jgi:hypothetical protein
MTKKSDAKVCFFVPYVLLVSYPDHNVLHFVFALVPSFL